MKQSIVITNIIKYIKIKRYLRKEYSYGKPE